MRILLAEDERSLSKAIVALLEKNNYSVDAVYDGDEMLNYIDERDAGEKIRQALFATLETGIKTADLGGNTTCSEFTKAIIERLDV